MKAALGLLEKLTPHPDSVGPADIAPLREAGVREEEIARVIYICMTFSVINRLADTMEFGVPTPEQLAARAKVSVDKLRAEGRV